MLQLSHSYITTITYYKILHFARRLRASQVALVVKNPPDNAGDIVNMGSIPRLGRSAEVGNDNLLQYLAWEIPCTEEPGRL